MPRSYHLTYIYLLSIRVLWSQHLKSYLYILGKKTKNPPETLMLTNLSSNISPDGTIIYKSWSIQLPLNIRHNYNYLHKVTYIRIKTKKRKQTTKQKKWGEHSWLQSVSFLHSWLFTLKLFVFVDCFVILPLPFAKTGPQSDMQVSCGCE